MVMEDIAAAIQRVKAVLRQRPAFGLRDEAPATARWQHGTRVVSSHANGTQLLTDMPAEVGGTGDLITPGWLFRAGLASCTATRIAMGAAAEGIELTALEVTTASRSDARGFFGISDAAGKCVAAGACEMQLHVRISANGATPQRLRELVEESQRCSPVGSVVERELPVALHIEVDAA